MLGYAATLLTTNQIICSCFNSSDELTAIGHHRRHYKMISEWLKWRRKHRQRILHWSLVCFGICVDLGSRNMSQFDGMNWNLLGSWGLDCKASIDSWALAEFSRRTLSRQGWASSRAGWSENVAYGVVDKVRYYTSFPVWIYQAPIFCVQTTIIFSGLVMNAYSSTGY